MACSSYYMWHVNLITIISGWSKLVTRIRLHLEWHFNVYQFKRHSASGSMGRAVASTGGVILTIVRCSFNCPKRAAPYCPHRCTWGDLWASKTVLCHSDNEAVVNVINTGSYKESHLTHMMRCIFFIEAKFNFIITPGKSNTNADNLSRSDSHYLPICKSSA